MSFAERMQRLFGQVETCRALVVGDTGTSTVLRACADAGTPQERHDALLAEAALVLGAAGKAALAEAGCGPGPVRRAVILAAGETRLHLRQDETGGEVACARCAAGLPDAALEAGMAALLTADG
jgi:hypothetical protein